MDYHATNLPQADKTAKTAPRTRARAPVRYRVTPSQPAAHLFDVVCSIDAPDPEGEILRLPAWIPGSYLIRDFSRHLVGLTATADGKRVAAEKIDLHSWRIAAPRGTRRLDVSYGIYAWDLSVRGAHLDESHGFFNGTSLFLRVESRAHLPCELELRRPAGAAYRDWAVATTLPTADARSGAASWAFGHFGHFRADSYAQLIDHPVEMGRFQKIEFTVRGVPHAVAITGQVRCDLERLARDLAKVCAWHIDFWGKPAPFSRYLFLVTAVGDGYGGLEHCDSTALLCRRQDLPSPQDPGISDDYLGFLGLASHEYFHAWNVKRLRPADFDTLDLQAPNPTELLWFFEGFTSYYDDLALVRCGLIDPQRYLDVLARTVNQVANTPGAEIQSVAQASYDAWTKYYRPDENSPNTTVSYYTKGALVALTLDLTMRASSQGKTTLDGALRRLWRLFGKRGKGIRASDIRDALTAECRAADTPGATISRVLQTAVHGTGPLPLGRLLATHGLTLAEAPRSPGSTGSAAARLGLQLEPTGEPRIRQLLAGGAAMAAGLAGGDVLVAVDGLRVSQSNLDTLLARYAPGESLTVHAFRRDELLSVTLTLPQAVRGKWEIRQNRRAGRASQTRQTAWLGHDSDR